MTAPISDEASSSHQSTAIHGSQKLDQPVPHLGPVLTILLRCVLSIAIPTAAAELVPGALLDYTGYEHKENIPGLSAFKDSHARQHPLQNPISAAIWNPLPLPMPSPSLKPRAFPSSSPAALPSATILSSKSTTSSNMAQYFSAVHQISNSRKGFQPYVEALCLGGSTGIYFLNNSLVCCLFCPPLCATLGYS